MRYGDAPDAWEAEVPPEGCEIVPMAFIDVMSYSYTCRDTLAKISRIFGKEDRAANWQQKAVRVSNKIREYLWSEERGACLDRDKQHRVLPTLMHNTLRAMLSVLEYIARMYGVYREISCLKKYIRTIVKKDMMWYDKEKPKKRRVNHE